MFGTNVVINYADSLPTHLSTISQRLYCITISITTDRFTMKLWIITKCLDFLV